jgi:uncharacterized membrane protein (Fun14 family)
MLIPLLGSLGIGFVWGWVLGYEDQWTGRWLFHGIFLAAATLLITAEVVVMVDWRAALCFLVGSCLSTLLHFGWQHKLGNHPERFSL